MRDASNPEPRQRWRLTFARDPVAADQVGRVALDAWQAALGGSGLPVALVSGGSGPGTAGRARLAFAAPLPANVSGEAELADLWLLERRMVWQVREAIDSRLPAGHRWIAAEDVWLGAPPLAGRVAAADWRVEMRSWAGAGEALRAAVIALLAADSLPRVRRKGGAERSYDLRPLLADLAVAEVPADDSRWTARVRTRFHPELGSGRPEEVIAALADAVGLELEIGSIARERLLLADDLALSLGDAAPRHMVGRSTVPASGVRRPGPPRR